MSRTDLGFDGSSTSMKRPDRKYTTLARSADSVFWLTRYIERSDFLARTIEASQRLASLPRAYNEDGSEWDSALESSGAVEGYREKYGATDPDKVIDYLAFDLDNPSSIRNCLEAARTNARSIRTALTAEMWDAMNGGYLEMKAFERNNPSVSPERIGRFLDFVKQTALSFEGAVGRTMLRDPSYWFSRLGLYVERADNTARILDVKYHVLLPDTEEVGGSLDYFQWAAVLRAVSALTAYHWVYRENIKPWLVADLLILRTEMPRSLLSCYQNIAGSLDSISQAYGRQGPSQRQAHKILAQLENAAIEDIFQDGLHEFVTQFLEDNNLLGAAIIEQYLV